jgi:anti-sigma B factor antagonist
VPAAVLSLTGDVDSDSVRGFAAMAQRLLDTDGLQRLIVDLGEVSFLDSSGLGLLVQLRTNCARSDIDLVLTRPTRSISALLLIAGLRDAFHIDNAPL